jgi:arylsulfatase A-like enzyme
LLEGQPTEWRTHVLIDWRSKGEHVPPYMAVRSKRWKYVRYRNGDRELYDRKNDPYELRSLHANPDYQQVMARLDKKLAPLR